MKEYLHLISLSPKEFSILRKLAQGSTARKIAEELSISIRTAETHIHNMKNKLALHTKNELIDIFKKNYLTLG